MDKNDTTEADTERPPKFRQDRGRQALREHYAARFKHDMDGMFADIDEPWMVAHSTFMLFKGGLVSYEKVLFYQYKDSKDLSCKMF